jgi:hypothetical protein
MKVVVNTCYGGFSVSEAAIKRYAEIKGLTLYPENDEYGTTYYIVPKDQRENLDNWEDLTLEERIASNRRADAQELKVERDETLAQVVEELGKAANGEYADLAIVEVPNDVSWRISEYDGKEWVAEVHRTWYTE